MRVRRATVKDVPAVMEVERGVEGLARWSESQYAGMMCEGSAKAALGQCLLVAEQCGAIVGLVGGRHVEGEACAELEALAVVRAQRRRGVARTLMQAWLAWAEDARGATAAMLEVRRSNVAAILFYRRLGFEEAGVRAGYYSEPVEDAVVMRLAMAGAGVGPR